MTLDRAERELSQRNIPAYLIIPESFTLEGIQETSQVLELRKQPNNINAIAIEQAFMQRLT